MNLNITRVDPSQNLKEVFVAAKRKFTRIPKIQDLILAGVPTEVIPTYCALSDYTNNKTGLCWPKMETLAIYPTPLRAHDPAPPPPPAGSQAGGVRRAQALAWALL